MIVRAPKFYVAASMDQAARHSVQERKIAEVYFTTKSIVQTNDHYGGTFQAETLQPDSQQSASWILGYFRETKCTG